MTAPVMGVCACSHLAVEHGTDSKAKALVAAQPCCRGGCDCERLMVVATRRLEMRAVEVPS